jgi:autoinducer 2 (AI-2) kinase
MSLLVALDAGTGGAKCGVFDLDGRLVALHREPWSYTVEADPSFPVVKSYAFDPERFWSILCLCARRALAAIGPRAGEVIGVGATSQREGCVFLDGAGREIYAGPNLDSRGFLQGMEILGSLGAARLYEITGHSAPFIFALARYLWFRKNDGRQVARILMINDWITYRLSGRFCSEPSNAAESMLFDFRARKWSNEILELFGVPESLLAPVLEPGSRVGEVGAATARATGIPVGTPVFVGGADTQCSLLGAGAVEPGDVAAILGTTCPIQAVVERPTLDPRANLWAGCHVVPDRWVIEANVGGTGDGYEWLVDLLVPRRRDRLARAEELAKGEVTGEAFAFAGPRIFDLTKMRPDLPGGIFFPFPTMQLRPSAGDLLRAYLESIAFAICSNLDLLRQVVSLGEARLIAGGGMSRNGEALRTLADVSGLTVRRAEEAECTGLGVAVLSAVGAGAYPDVKAAARAMCRHRDIAPDRDRHERYGAVFQKWRELYDVLDRVSI